MNAHLPPPSDNAQRIAAACAPLDARKADATNVFKACNILGSWDDQVLNAADSRIFLKKITTALKATNHNYMPDQRAMPQLVRAIRQWEKQSIPNAAAYCIEDWYEMLEAFTYLRVSPSGAFIKAFETHRDTTTKATTLRKRAKILWSFARMGISIDAGFITDTLRDLRAIPNDDFHYYGQLIWSAACLDSLKNTAKNPELKTLAAVCRGKRFQTRATNPIKDLEYAQMRDACLWFDLGLPPYQPPFQLEYTSSPIERRAREKFQDAQLAVLPSAQSKIDSLDKSTDITLQMKAGLVHVEIDGVWHFMYDLHTQRYNGSTLFQIALMQKLCPGAAFVRMPDLALKELLQTKPTTYGRVLRHEFDRAAQQALAHGTYAAAFTLRNGKSSLRPLSQKL